MATVTISSKGWVVIPAAFRKKYGIEPGGSMEVVDYGGVLSLVPSLPNPVRDAQGMLKGGTALTRALVRERGKEKASEQSKGR